MRRKIIISKQKPKQKLDRDCGLMDLAEDVHYLRSSACFECVGLAAYFQRLVTSRASLRIFHLKAPFGTAFHLGQIWNFFFCCEI